MAKISGYEALTNLLSSKRNDGSFYKKNRCHHENIGSKKGDKTIYDITLVSSYGKEKLLQGIKNTKVNRITEHTPVHQQSVLEKFTESLSSLVYVSKEIFTPFHSTKFSKISIDIKDRLREVMTDKALLFALPLEFIKDEIDMAKFEISGFHKEVKSLWKSLKNFNISVFLTSKSTQLCNSSRNSAKCLATCIYNNEICMSWLLILKLLWGLVYLYHFYSYLLKGSLMSKKVNGTNWYSNLFRMNLVMAEYFENALRESVRVHARLSFTFIHTSDNRIPTAVPIYEDSFIYRKDRLR